MKPEKYLKIHMKNGTLFVFHEWKQEKDSIIAGKGKHLNINRRQIPAYEDSVFNVHLRDVALLETNDYQSLSNPAVGLAMFSVASIGLTAYCIVNPKACFGSCPTFYIPDGDTVRLVAEGYSSSILPSLEKRDVDMLYDFKPANTEDLSFNIAPDTTMLRVTQTNEALETHVTRYLHLLAVPKKEDERVFKTTDKTFYRLSNIRSPIRCSAPEGDCLNKVKTKGTERYSKADSFNLAAKEYIELSFPPGSEDKLQALIISHRQTFVTTFIFYQTLAYMGNAAGYWLTKAESNPAIAERGSAIREALGGIEIQVNKGSWVTIGEITEAGPITTDYTVIPLPEQKTDSVHVRIRMSAGLWRIGNLALADINEKAEVMRIHPHSVEKQSGSTSGFDARQKLTDTSNSYLITLPGDIYHIYFPLPDEPEQFEYFLDTRGYYLEWMRDEWLKDESVDMVIKAFRKPEAFLKMLENEMEEIFWNSRYVRP